MLIFRHATRRLALSLLLVTLFPSQAAAAPGDLDTTFGGDGWEQTDIRGTGATDFGSAVAIQADGKIVVAGSSRATGNYDFALTRYNSDGTLDTGFGVDGIVITSLSSRDDLTSAVAIQSDGAIVAVGHAWAGRKKKDAFAIVRYLPDGRLDPSFGTDGIVLTNFTPRPDYARAVIIQANGKIVAAGTANYTWDGDDSSFALARYNTNGHLDTSFGSDGKRIVSFGDAHAEADGLAIQANGKIVVSGSTMRHPTEYRRNSRLAVLRLRPNGRVDPTFSGNGRVLTRTGLTFPFGGAGVEIQTDGKIVVAGSASGRDEVVFLLVRYQRDGSRDRTFSGNGLRRIDIPGPGGFPENPEIDFGLDVAVQADGKIVEAGVTIGEEGRWIALTRVHADGSTDTSFGNQGKVVTSLGSHDWADAVTLQADGKIVIAGATYLQDDDFLVARYLN